MNILLKNPPDLLEDFMNFAQEKAVVLSMVVIYTLSIEGGMPVDPMPIRTVPDAGKIISVSLELIVLMFNC